MKIYETDFGIRFILLWNGLRIPFLEQSLKFVKQNSWSVLEKYETDPKSRFIKKKHGNFWNRLWIPFLEKKIRKYQMNFEIHFAFSWNGSRNSLHKIKKKKKIQWENEGTIVTEHEPWTRDHLKKRIKMKEPLRNERDHTQKAQRTWEETKRRKKL